MKQRNLKKKVGVFLLAATMTVNLFPAFSAKVHAAELPDTTRFAEKADLIRFNTNDNDGTTDSAKVYFGQDSSGQAQAWWIAGSQANNSLTLFAASPLAMDQPFEPARNPNKTYSVDWNCTYQSNVNNLTLTTTTYSV